MKEDNERILFEALLTGDVSGAIRNQESRGQERLVNSDVLPIECPRAELEKMGIVFGDEVDELFINVTLPDGWKKERTGHSMWSILKDDKGRERASIFYKAAFYDRRAFMRLESRFFATAQPVGGWDSDNTIFHAVVLDGGQIVWESEKTPPKPENATNEEMIAWYDFEEGLKNQAVAWLNENYPDWENPLAYWD